MSSSYLLLRRREARLRRFGLALGGVVALLAHLVLFWGPRVDYRPVLEQVRVRRVLVARPYQPTPPPPPPPPPAAPRPPPPTPVQAPPPVAAPATAPAAAAQPDAAPAPRRQVADISAPNTKEARARPKGTDDATLAPAPAQPDDWRNLLASLEGRQADIREKWQERKAEIEAQSAAVSPHDTQWGSEGTEEPGDGFLDSRIRMTVVSYPPTAIENEYPAIPYPDLRFRRSQLEKGTCRVWYRVWVDGRGEIVRTQLKTPATEAERKQYVEFVTQVEQSVAEWPFPRQEAEVHIDVFFQIE